MSTIIITALISIILLLLLVIYSYTKLIEKLSKREFVSEAILPQPIIQHIPLEKIQCILAINTEHDTLEELDVSYRNTLVRRSLLHHFNTFLIDHPKLIQSRYNEANNKTTHKLTVYVDRTQL